MGLENSCQNKLKTQLPGFEGDFCRLKVKASTACVSYIFGNNIFS